MSNISFLGFPNHTAQAYVASQVIGTAGQPVDMTGDWLKTDEPTDRARITNLDPYASQWGFSTSLVPLTIDGIALVNHNIADGGQVRFVGWGGSVANTANLPSVMPPQTITASTNLSGVVGNIDEDISTPDGLNVGPSTVTSPWSVTLKFFTLPGTINTGADMMALVLRVRRVFTGAGADGPVYLPTVTASLVGPTFALGYRAITVSSVGGQLLIFPFRRSDFTSVSNLQVLLSFTAGQSFSGGQYAVLEAASVHYDVLTLNSPTYDSGWMTVESDSRLALVAPTQHIHYFPVIPWTTVISYCVQVRSDQSIHNPLITIANLVPAGAVPRDPLSFVQAGVAPAGRAIIPADGVRKGIGPMAGLPEVQGFSGVTASGQGYGADAYGYRTSPPVEIIVTRDELLLIQDQIGFRRGRNMPFYVAIEPGIALQYQMFTAYWATLKSMGEPRPLGRYKAGGSMKFTIEMSFQEKI